MTVTMIMMMAAFSILTHTIYKTYLIFWSQLLLSLLSLSNAASVVCSAS